MAEQDANRELIQFARTVTIKPLSEASVLVACNAKCIVRLHVFTKFEKCYPSKVASDVMEVYPGKHFHAIVVNLSTSVIELTEHQRVATTSPRPSEICYMKSDEYSRYPVPIDPVYFVKNIHYKPILDRLQRMKKHVAVQQADEGSSNNDWRYKIMIADYYEEQITEFLNILKKFMDVREGYLGRIRTSKLRVEITDEASAQFAVRVPNLQCTIQGCASRKTIYVYGNRQDTSRRGHRSGNNGMGKSNFLRAEKG